ncbi:MAG TPA: hypothetical protein VF212_13925 [Longimicrobiales bacterium]
MNDRLDVNPARRRSRMDYRAAPVLRTEHAEGGFGRLLEQQAAKIPSQTFLFLALGSMGASLALEVYGNDKLGRFIGMWAAPLLIMGVYNKLVKLLGPQ